MNLNGVIFDMDGTLVDTMPICEQCLRETIAQYTGRSLSKTEVYDLFGPSEEGILWNVIGEETPAAYQYFLDLYERMHADQEQIVFFGVYDLLANLRASGIRTAIATGKAPETAAITLRYTGLEPYIERVETGFLEGGNKPRSIEMVLESWGMLPAKAAYVGDALSDMRAAQQAGVLPIGAAWSETALLSADNQRNGWMIFKQIEDFNDWVKAGKSL